MQNVCRSHIVFVSNKNKTMVKVAFSCLYLFSACKCYVLLPRKMSRHSIKWLQCCLHVKSFNCHYVYITDNSKLKSTQVDYPLVTYLQTKFPKNKIICFRSYQTCMNNTRWLWNHDDLPRNIKPANQK